MVRVPLGLQGASIDPGRLAGRLEAQVDEFVRLWVGDLKRIGPILRQSWPQAVKSLTAGTGIYPYAPSDLTPTDSNILWGHRGVVNRLGGDVENPWAIRPRHTAQGWTLGETVTERYIKTLNL